MLTGAIGALLTLVRHKLEGVYAVCLMVAGAGWQLVLSPMTLLLPLKACLPAYLPETMLPFTQASIELLVKCNVHKKRTTLSMPPLPILWNNLLALPACECACRAQGQWA